MRSEGWRRAKAPAPACGLKHLVPGQQHRLLVDNAFNGHPAREEQAGDGKIPKREIMLFKDSIVLFSLKTKAKPKVYVRYKQF